MQHSKDKATDMPQSPPTQDPTVFNFVLMARFHEHVAVEDLRSALDRLKGRHRAFDLRSTRDFNNINAPGTGPYPLDVLPDRTPDDWERVAAQELARPFDPNGPRVRFVLINHSQADDLLIVCDHNGSDGLSGTLLLQDLLELLNHSGLHLPPLPAPPPVWEILPPSVTRSFSGRLRFVLLKVALTVMGWGRRRRRSVRTSPSFQVTSSEFSAEWTSAMVERCRVEGASVHAAVCAAWLSALDPLDAKHPSRRSVSSPVSLRRHLAPEMRGCAGMYYTTVVTPVDYRSVRGFWDIAREIKEQMTRAESEPSFYNTPLVLKILYRLMSQQPENGSFQMPELPVNYDYSITNLGRVDNSYVFSETNKVRYSVEKLYAPIVNAFPGEKTVGVCTLAGQIRFVFTTFSDDMDLCKAQDWMERAVKILQDEIQIS